MAKSTNEFAEKRAWVKANRGALSEIAVKVERTRAWVYQVFYYGHPTADGKVERLLFEAGAPHMEARLRRSA